ncbi:MAG: hypothetical protein JSU85_04920 [Candidatus Zixiibacteriota bacterium]|nr:MAG: hypothetical protein JSU85_04920 [candidate division Zixibacteria bacterium]
MKERALLELMIANYSANPGTGWVPAEKCAQIMVSYNQRFQQWRLKGIKIENRMIGDKSEYKLYTHPSEIDRDNFRSKVSQMALEIN